MRKTILTGFTFFLLFFLYACGQQSSTVTDNNWWPHQDGYSWTYNVSTSWYGSVEGYRSTVEGYRSTTETWTFDGTANLYNLTVQKLINSNPLPNHSSLEAEYILINNSGAFDYGSEGNPTSEPVTVLSYPIEIGGQWYSQSYIFCKVLGKENINVPAGTYETYKIRFDLGSGDYLDKYYAKNVGMVKSFSSINLILYDSSGNMGSATIIATYELTGKNF